MKKKLLEFVWNNVYIYPIINFLLIIPAFFYMPKIVHIMLPICSVIMAVSLFLVVRSIYKRRIEQRLSKFFRNIMGVSIATIYIAIFINEQTLFFVTFMNYVITFLIVIMPKMYVESDKYDFASCSKKIEGDKNFDTLNLIMKDSFELMVNSYAKHENLLYLPKFDSYLKITNKDQLFSTMVNADMLKRNGINLINNAEKSFTSIVVNKNDSKSYSVDSIDTYLKENQLDYTELTIKDFELVEMYNY